jgi:autophagy-related protein 17
MHTGPPWNTTQASRLVVQIACLRVLIFTMAVSTTSSSRGSTANMSKNPSPSASLQKPTTQLEGLIAHLLASKRSLTSIHHVHRATTILSRARSDLEATTILAARTTFLRRSLASQLKILRGVQFELEEIVHSSQAELSLMLKELDAAGKRLEETVHRLKDTKIEAGFRDADLAASGRSGDQATIETKETLHDFVDAGPVEELKDHLKTSIDEVQQAKAEMDQSLQDFEEDLQAVNDALRGKIVNSPSSSSSFKPPNIPAILWTLENNAKEMATSLESLVQHFDLCVTAIHHAGEGGVEVAKNLEISKLPEGVSVEGLKSPTHSIGEDEKREMMDVLHNDAAEVEDVVVEIQDRISQMEADLELIELWKEMKEGDNEEVMTCFQLLEQVGDRLPGYIKQSQAFVTRWSEERLKIEEGMGGLGDLKDVYRNFLGAYDGLIVEVARRKAVRNQMEKIMRDAQSRLRQLYDEDVEEREAFRLDQGEYLPMDIWSGLSDPPPMYAFSRIGDEREAVPELPRKTVEEALRRLKAASPRP